MSLDILVGRWFWSLLWGVGFVMVVVHNLTGPPQGLLGVLALTYFFACQVFVAWWVLDFLGRLGAEGRT